jgi:hypothetical protein
MMGRGKKVENTDCMKQAVSWEDNSTLQSRKFSRFTEPEDP